MGDSTQALEQTVHIGGLIDRVGYDDVIEGPVQSEFLTGLHVECAVGYRPPCLLDLAAGQVDPGNVAVGQMPEEFTAATADFEHTSVRRDHALVVAREDAAIASAREV